MASLYTKLSTTATSFVHSTDYNLAKSPTGLDTTRIREITSPTFRHSWGHKYYTASRPNLNQVLDYEGYLGHLFPLAAKVQSARTVIHDLFVDAHKKTVVVRVSYFLKPKNTVEEAENEVIWILTMNATGTKVDKSVEFIDGDASNHLGALFSRARGQKS